jgi:acyl-lipid (7-3)-desaturase (Delta-4 desaturase)
MGPDADKLRQRNTKQRQIHGGGIVESGELTSTNNDRVISKLDGLRNHEVCIDGVIYDLTSFDHPGGESILIFGGNDVTVQYKMIHPYHTSKHLEKMKKVGKVADYTSE